MEDLRRQFLELEENFNSDRLLEWHNSHAEVPIFAICIYFVIVFWVPDILKKFQIKFTLRGPVFLWNVFLATFSIVGAYRTIPALAEGLRTRGFEGTICDDGAWFLDGRTGLWIAAFIYSKMPELMDTLFLVLRCRTVILLHWFHHCTVLLYCWHAYLHKSGPGIWFATMNFTVHAIMYTYYALMEAKFKKLLKPIAPIVTSLQILQMLGGMIVTVTAGKTLQAGGKCAADPANLKLGFAMYFSYFILFFMLFWNKYMTDPCTCTKKDSKNGDSRRMLCGVDLNKTDAAGHFNDNDAASPTKPSKKKE